MSHFQRIIERLDTILTEFVQDEPVSGLAVGIVRNQEIFYVKGFGTSDIRTGSPVVEGTMFHMASVSKTCVATGIMQLVQQEKIELDSPVVQYLPYFKLNDHNYADITVRQLLNHTSGMPDEDDFEWDRPEFDEHSLERYVRRIENHRLLSTPGEKFAYSNIGYEILGDVIAKVSGLSFEEYMKSLLLEPAQMHGSSFFKSDIPSDQLASPHVHGFKDGYGPESSDIFPYHRAHGPSSTLYSSAEEMCRYMIFQLNRGMTPEGQQILQPEGYGPLWEEYAETHYGSWMNGIGLSWFLGSYKDCRIMSHSGMDTGFRSNLMLMPDQGLGLVLMTNCDYIGLKVVSTSIIDLLLGEDIRYVKKSLAHYLSKITITSGVEAAWREYSSMSSHDLERYLILEGEFNFIAYTMMEKGFLTEGIKVLELSVQLFPESSNLYDSLGEMYLSAGEPAMALRHYEKSVELDPTHREGKIMIEKLRASM
ncbi:CubicO group peptidase, beta-lactamase class C family [Paenibacillus uliginis N3/975]|uniref:CubicO group peptidase, beta-lactamase class C family n=1 Tax=Paenibacillus uliginis N3/975 TaxID=1313296 RepID=A0A1X7HQ99_9BACL|nr:serine hydrolase domain-containing protein [Paenibacillus uliginis]SMF90810.1 CubicO group peptidase, beta-lactamase class C family [Paenibacillus uliginis N3/975]